MNEIHFDKTFFIYGVSIAIICLIIWNLIGQIELTFSIFSPTGPIVTIGGTRVKHWLIGIVIMVFAPFIKNAKLMSFLLGFGLMLFIDEVPELLAGTL